MKRLLLFTLALTCAAITPAAETPAPAKIRALVLTGGHGFDAKPFFRIFSENPDITFTSIEHTKGTADGWERADLSAGDVVVLYDMPAAITPAQQARVRSLFARGTGLLVLHHALCGIQKSWPDYERIIGGLYPTVAGEKSGGYRHDVDIPVVIAKRDHPITQGLADFTVRDEIYWDFRVGADVTPLLTTTHPDSGKTIAWCRTEEKSRIVYLQLGHGLPCYDDPHYREIVARSLRWVAQR
jgi:type 1 glutamine amidotransferase